MTVAVSPKAIEVLLVEDNIGAVGLTQEALNEGGLPIHLTAARDGVEAMDMLRRINGYAGAPRPDLILLDLDLPRKDGRAVLQEIKGDAELKTIPVVVLTTSDADKDIIATYGAQANCCITKPVATDRFIEIVQLLAQFWFTIVKVPSRESGL